MIRLESPVPAIAALTPTAGLGSKCRKFEKAARVGDVIVLVASNGRWWTSIRDANSSSFSHVGLLQQRYKYCDMLRALHAVGVVSETDLKAHMAAVFAAEKKDNESDIKDVRRTAARLGYRLVKR